jgi:hypothetical protein
MRRSGWCQHFPPLIVDICIDFVLRLVRTQVTDNLKIEPSSVPELKDRNDALVARLEGANGYQLGDTKKFIEVVVDTVQTYGMAEGRERAPRLPMAPGALYIARQMPG